VLIVFELPLVPKLIPALIFLNEYLSYVCFNTCHICAIFALCKCRKQKAVYRQIYCTQLLTSAVKCGPTLTHKVLTALCY
jgi:hypothetical protein